MAFFLLFNMVSYEIDLDRNFMYTKDEDGKYHSFFGNPAIEYIDHKLRIWYTHGVINRDINEGPAYLSSDEAKYFVNGRLHNNAGEPAVIRRLGTNYCEEFWENGQILETKTHNKCLKDFNEIFTYNFKFNNGICVYFGSEHLTKYIRIASENGIQKEFKQINCSFQKNI